MTALFSVNIFATKGIEYLFIILFLLAFVVLMRLLFKGGKKEK